MGSGSRRGIRAHAWWLPLSMLSWLGCEHGASLGVLEAPDASTQDAADEWLDTPLFDSQGGSQDAFDALGDAILGHTFAGGTVYDNARSDRFEIDFHADGTFSTRCSDDADCEPFGTGTRGDDVGRFLLTTLDANGLGLGEVRVGVEGPPYVLSAYNIRYREDGGLLTFSVQDVISFAEGYRLVPVVSTLLVRADALESRP